MLNSTFSPFLLTLWMALFPALCSLFAMKGLVHFFQLESYQFPGFFRTLRRNPYRTIWPGVLTAAVCVGLYFVAAAAQKAATGFLISVEVFCLLLAAACGLLIGRIFSVRKAKKKMVMTGRLKRLYGVSFLVMTGLGLLIAAQIHPIAAMLWPLFLPLVLALSGLLAWPLEKLISECYFRDARRKLMQNPNLIRIGITGSYGKTSVKHILGTLLTEKYPVLITPASYNTPMGVTRTIRERLQPSHRVFIAEMGARHVGDIKELCRLVHPTIGLITSVGPQHLETFHTIERVASTKYELIEALPRENAHAYFWDDNAFCTQMAEKTLIPKTLCCRDGKKSGYYVEEKSLTQEGSRFVLHLGEYGAVECVTRLLGEHNLQNILLSAACAVDLGLTLRQIAHGVAKLVPVPHRLELLRSSAGFTVIDDAFNTNPVSAKASLKVLRSFEGRKIIITPGMVELGEKEKEYNHEFGQEIARSVDISIIIGKKRVQPILDGILEGGFPRENLYQVSSLEESTRLLNRLIRPGDVVLYENDLPDHYREA